MIVHDLCYGENLLVRGTAGPVFFVGQVLRVARQISGKGDVKVARERRRIFGRRFFALKLSNVCEPEPPNDFCAIQYNTFY